MKEIVHFLGLDSQESLEASQQITDYLNYRLNRGKPHEWETALLEKKWYWILFPQVFSFTKEPIPYINESEKSIIEENFRWEIYGILSHAFFFFDNRKIFLTHLECLKNKAEKLSLNSSVIEDLKTAIEQLHNVSDLQSIV